MGNKRLSVDLNRDMENVEERKDTGHQKITSVRK
jgi:hypothetical protein